MNKLSNHQEDTHFYLDNAPPKEVTQVLRVLSPDIALNLGEIAETLRNYFDFIMQKDITYSPRRLFDLGLASQKKQGNKLAYKLTEKGVKLQHILNVDRPFAIDLLHFLHYSNYKGAPSDRKYLWSYRKCCEHLWSKKYAIKPNELAGIIQSDMRERFPQLDYSTKAGARFNSTAVSAVSTWLQALEPSPILKLDKPLQLRVMDRFELALLALDYTYRNNGYVYSDPVLMDEEIISQVSSVFFLDHQCCRNLLKIASRITNYLKILDTLAGPSITLKRAVIIEEL